MIENNDLHFTIHDTSCPNLHYEFDFSGFYNQNLAKDVVLLLKQKYAHGVSLNYLSVLSTAFVHYDNYLRKSMCSNSEYSLRNNRSIYSDYLHALLGKDGKKYSDRYIRFLIYASKSILLFKEELEEEI